MGLRYVMAFGVAVCHMVLAAASPGQEAGGEDPFRQLEELWPTPNERRTASGAPGPDYWQQSVAYDIDVTLDAEAHRIDGRVEIAYTNNSPHTLRYLWLQLDQNRFKPHSVSQLSRRDDVSDGALSMARLHEAVTVETAGMGYDIRAVEDGRGAALPYVIRDTMMRVDLSRPLEPGDNVRLAVDYGFAIPPTEHVSNRTAYEILDSGAPNYFVAMWYPRLAAYTDYGGWVIKSFLYGEPALDFADFDVSVTAPDTFVLAATGALQNPREVLSADQRARLDEARDADSPQFVILPEEASENAIRAPGGTRTWRYAADEVRDFAFAASPAFIWDAMGYTTRDGNSVMAQSLYPPVALPLWHRYSTEAVAHTLDVYGRMAGPYPWPHATSINSPIRSGMEYPMLASNAPRAEKDGTYSRRQKYGLIGVVIHEVGHNWFPMIVNSDERHWLWMDEGLNSFLDELAMREWEEDPPNLRSAPHALARRLARPDQRPIMTQSDAYFNRGQTGYSKVSAALTVLRETVLGRELFDFAFREYTRRWWFKRPQPADFFRTMEDASGRDLDWFWRGWFYGTDHVDVAIDRVTMATIDTEEPDTEADYNRRREAEEPDSLTAQRNAGMTRRIDERPALRDVYNEHDEHTVTESDREKYGKMLDKLQPWQKEMLSLDSRLYFVDFVNKGGLVTPLPLRITYADGESEKITLPAEIWRLDSRKATRMIISERDITSIELDPDLEIADADRADNNWPRETQPLRLKLERPKEAPNLMQKMKQDRDDNDG